MHMRLRFSSLRLGPAKLKVQALCLKPRPGSYDGSREILFSSSLSVAATLAPAQVLKWIPEISPEMCSGILHSERRIRCVPLSHSGDHKKSASERAARNEREGSEAAMAIKMTRNVTELAVSTRAATAVRRVSRATSLRAAATAGRSSRGAVLCERRERRGSTLVLAAAAPEAAEAEVESRSTLRIKLKCYSSEPLQEAVEAILDVAFRTGCDKTGPAYLPTRRRKYTILKSPHVNKDSREQFEIRTHQRIIDLKNVSAQTIDGLMALDLPAGVDVEVKI